MTKKASLLWIDLEMTGLDPVKDRILEVAAIATDWQLHRLAEYTAIVKVPDSIIKRRMVGDFWRKHPESYQSLVDQNPTGQSSRAVERELLAFVKQHFGKEVYLAGNSVHQDRKFIDHEWPDLSKLLHYRILDVSAWKVYFVHARGDRYQKAEAHRALDDINGSIEELQHYIGFLK